MLDDDNNGNRRFYLTDSTGGMVEMVKGISPSLSPFVMMESGVEGSGPITDPDRNYPIYFYVRARRAKDGDAAAEATEEAWMHAKNFIAWLCQKHEEESAFNTSGDYARINMEDYIDIVTVGPIEDAWYAVMIQLSRQEPINMCVDPNLYIELEEEPEEEFGEEPEDE